MNGFHARAAVSIAAGVALCIATASAAEESPRTTSPSEAADHPYWRGDLTYAVSARRSQTQQGTFSSNFGGLAPSYLRLDGAWYRGRQPPGLVADLRLEWFRVLSDGLGGANANSWMVMPYSASLG